MGYKLPFIAAQASDSLFMLTLACFDLQVFLSIKGVYFQAEIQDQPVTWIVPYQFCQEVK